MKRARAALVATALIGAAVGAGLAASRPAQTVRCQAWSADGGVRELGEQGVDVCLRMLDADRRLRP